MNKAVDSSPALTHVQKYPELGFPDYNSQTDTFPGSEMNRIDEKKIIVHQPTATQHTHVTQYGPKPQSVICPYCRANICTYVETDPSIRTHFLAYLMCMGMVFTLCAWIPYVIDSCNVKNHYCPCCRSYLGRYN